MSNDWGQQIGFNLLPIHIALVKKLSRTPINSENKGLLEEESEYINNYISNIAHLKNKIR